MKKMDTRESEEKWINTVAFFVYGFVKFSMEILVITTTEDMLSGTSIPTTLFLLATYLPHSLCAAILPNFVGKVGQLAVSTSIFASFVAGLLLMGLPVPLELKFLGAVGIGLGAGITDTLLLGSTARYSDITVHAFVGGTGASGVLGSLFYTGMTTWLCFSPSTIPLMFLALPPLVLVFHCLMEKKPTESELLISKAADQSKIAYTALGQCGEQYEHIPFSCREKLRVVWKISLLAVSLFIGFFSKYLTIQGIITTLAFPSAPFDPRDHYPFYILLYIIGEFLGRSYGLFVLVVKCTEIPLVTRHTWIFSTAVVVIQLFLVYVNWYRSLSNVYIVLGILFLYGLVNGVLYCNTFIAASRGSSSRHIEYARAFLVISISTGVMAGGLIGLYTEPKLREHCQRTYSPSGYCLTRSTHEWNASVSCLAYA